MKIALLDDPFLEGHFEIGHRTQAVDDRALHHRFGAAHVDDRAHVGGYRNAVHRDPLVVVNTYVGYFGNVCCM